jgi:hypothetical protein
MIFSDRKKRPKERAYKNENQVKTGLDSGPPDYTLPGYPSGRETAKKDS